MIRHGALALLACVVAVGPLAAQDVRQNVRVGGVAMLARDQGLYDGQPYDQRTMLIGARGGLRLGPLFGRATYLQGTLPAYSEGAAAFVPERSVRAVEAVLGLMPAAWLRLEGAAWFRGYESTSLGSQWWSGYRAGVGFQGDLVPGMVGAGATIHLIPVAAVTSANDGEELSRLGWSGEVEMAGRLPGVPARVAVGYRMERFDSQYTRFGQSVDRQMRLGGVLLSAEVAF